MKHFNSDHHLTDLLLNTYINKKKGNEIEEIIEI